MKVLVFIDHDIICRHFIMSGALSELSKQFDVKYVFPDDGGRRVKLTPSKLGLGDNCRILRIDAERQQYWRWQLFADQLKFRTGRHERKVRRIRRKLLGWKASTLLTIAGLPGVEGLWHQYLRMLRNARPNVELLEFLQSERPNIIIHPSVLEGIFINDLLETATALDVPCIVAMNSWDNPSTKRAVVELPSWLLVWGEQTKEHAIRFVGMPPGRVVPFGVAQFDVFAQPPRRTREELVRSLGIEPGRRLFLFAGSNARTDEVAILQALDDAIESGRLPNAAMIYRPHPWGGGGRGGNRIASMRFRHVVIDPNMQAYIDALAAADPGITLPDYRDTHDLLSAIDVVVSPMSTILVEAALHGKAVIVHAPASDDPLAPLGSSLPMLHFEEFLALSDVRLTRSEAALTSEMQALLEPGEAEARGRRLREDCTRFVAPFDAPWRDRIVTFLQGVHRDHERARRSTGQGSA